MGTRQKTANPEMSQVAVPHVPLPFSRNRRSDFANENGRSGAKPKQPGSEQPVRDSECAVPVARCKASERRDIAAGNGDPAENRQPGNVASCRAACTAPNLQRNRRSDSANENGRSGTKPKQPGS